MSIRADKLEDYFDLLVWSRHTGIISDTETQSLIQEAKRHQREATAIFHRAKALREAIHHICRSIVYNQKQLPVNIELLNGEIAESQKHQKLVFSGDNFVWEWVRGNNSLDRILWPIARSAMELLTEGDLSRLRECVGDDCHWLFEDASKNRSRQWCDMQDCGNLAKVRRFRSRPNSGTANKRT